MNIRYLLFLFLLSLGCLRVATAQTDSLQQTLDVDVDMQMEDIMNNTNTTDDIDFTFITDNLQDWLRKPLNLNDASREQLLQLPGMNDFLVNKLYDYLSLAGALSSVYELQAVEGFSEPIVMGIMPYVTTDARLKDIDPNKQHPAGPRFSEVRKGMTYEFTQRNNAVLEPQKGYGPPEYNPDGTLKSQYLGSRWRNYTRLRARYGQYVSVAVTGEKDAGEQFRFSSKDRLYGYDFLSAHAAISNYGNLKSLVIGDFNIQTGQGLIFSSGLGFGKGTEVIMATKMQQRGIRPYASVNENTYRRGVAATYAIRRVYFTAFYSRTAQDGSTTYAAADTLSDVAEAFTSGFALGGFHRTPAEFAKRRNLFVTSTGGRVEYKGKRLTIGTSHLYESFSAILSPSPNYYNQYYFSGKNNYLNGVDFDWVLQNFNFFGEIARSKSGGMAAVGGVIAALSPKVDATLHLRSFDKDFHSLNGYTFGEQPRTLRNERGVYMGLRMRPNTKWTLSTFFDKYYFPYQRFGAAYPSGGYDFFAQAEYLVRRGTMLYARFRVDNKDYNADRDSLEEGQLLYYLVGQRRYQFRLQYQSQLSRQTLIRTRLETSLFHKEDQPISRGYVLYQDFIYRFNFKLRLTMRYALFATDDYPARIYVYENDMPGSFSIIPYSNTGSRYYIMLNYKLIRGLDLWIRLAQTRYFNPNNGQSPDNLYYTPATIGSGLDEITGNHRTDLRLQLRYTF